MIQEHAPGCLEGGQGGERAEQERMVGASNSTTFESKSRPFAHDKMKEDEGEMYYYNLEIDGEEVRRRKKEVRKGGCWCDTVPLQMLVLKGRDEKREAERLEEITQGIETSLQDTTCTSSLSISVDSSSL